MPLYYFSVIQNLEAISSVLHQLTMETVGRMAFDGFLGGGFWAATLALVLPLPGDYFPLEGPGVIGQQESVGGEAGHSLLTAFPYKCGSRRRGPFVLEGVRESLADLLRQSLTAKGGNRGCWSGCYGRSAAENITDRRASTAFYMDGGISTVVGTGLHRPILIGL